MIFSPVRIGNTAGVNAAAPIMGGIESSEMTADVYPRMQAFMLHALMQVARRSEADPTFAFYQRLDPDAAALMVRHCRLNR